jgi:hypothetical protein
MPVVPPPAGTRRPNRYEALRAEVARTHEAMRTEVRSSTRSKPAPAPPDAEAGVAMTPAAETAPDAASNVEPVGTADLESLAPAIGTPPAPESVEGAPLDAEASPALDPGNQTEVVAAPVERRRVARRPQWPATPAADAPSMPRLVDRRVLWVAVGVVALFTIGWILGRIQPGGATKSGPSPVVRAMRALGLAAPRFEAEISSKPPGAWIKIDGKTIAKKTPAAVELAPGAHRVEIGLADLGSTTLTVQGQSGQRTPLMADLNGTLEIRANRIGKRIHVTVDGRDHGDAPVTVRDLAPGPHEIRFASPGVTPWGQTIRLGVREDVQILARPFESPATGLVDVRASITEIDGMRPVSGAVVWVDGRRRGVTPITLELPAGPHSIRVVHRDEQAPIQLIDLPGGNQRFATFQFGLGSEAPKLTLAGPSAPARNRTTAITAALDGVAQGEVREMWLNVRSPEGVWKRYAMEILPGSGAVVGSVTFPNALIDSRGRAPFYVSAITALGDEYYTEIQNADTPATTVSADDSKP